MGFILDFLKQTTTSFEYQMLAFQDWITNMQITDPLWFVSKKLAHRDSWSDVMIFWRTDSRFKMKILPKCCLYCFPPLLFNAGLKKRWWSSWNCGHWSTWERRIVTRLRLRMHQTRCGKIGCQIGYDWGTNCYNNPPNTSIKFKKYQQKIWLSSTGSNINTFSICKIQVGWVLSRAGLATLIV